MSLVHSKNSLISIAFYITLSLFWGAGCKTSWHSAKFLEGGSDEKDDSRREILKNPSANSSMLAIVKKYGISQTDGQGGVSSYDLHRIECKEKRNVYFCFAINSQNEKRQIDDDDISAIISLLREKQGIKEDYNLHKIRCHHSVNQRNRIGNIHCSFAKASLLGRHYPIEALPPSKGIGPENFDYTNEQDNRFTLRDDDHKRVTEILNQDLAIRGIKSEIYIPLLTCSKNSLVEYECSIFFNMILENESDKETIRQISSIFSENVYNNQITIDNLFCSRLLSPSRQAKYSCNYQFFNHDENEEEKVYLDNTESAIGLTTIFNALNVPPYQFSGTTRDIKYSVDKFMCANLKSKPSCQLLSVSKIDSYKNGDSPFNLFGILAGSFEKNTIKVRDLNCKEEECTYFKVK